MKHEILLLNKDRSYVRVNDVWYDTRTDLTPKLGQYFLVGQIEEILDHATYTERYPESTEERYYYVTEKTMSGGFLRRTLKGEVVYGVNPETPATGTAVS